MKEFFRLHYLVIKDLFSYGVIAPVIILLNALIGPTISWGELKLTQYIVNGVTYRNLNNSSDFRIVINYLMILLVLLLSTTIWNYIASRITSRFTKKTVSTTRERFLAKIGSIPYDNFESKEIYDKIFIASTAPETYSETFEMINGLITKLVTLIVYIVMMCTFSLWSLPSIIICIILFVILNRTTSKKWDALYDNFVIPNRRRSNYFEKIFNNRIDHSTVQLDRQYSFFSNKYEEYTNAERKYTLKLNALSFMSKLKVSLPLTVFIFFFLVFVSSEVKLGNSEIGTYTLISSLLFNVFVLSHQLVGYFFSEKEYLKVVSTFKELMEIEEERDSQNIESGLLTAKQLAYRYLQSDYYSLKEATFQVKRGEKVAVVGANGSGKSTLMLILLSLAHCYEGEYNNGIGRIASVLQDFQFYQLTIRENIELGSGYRMSDEDLISILRRVGIWDDIEKLPCGLDTPIGQINEGVELSKGQFQKLAIARLIACREASVWVLDEPTAFLDPNAEMNVYKEILTLSEEKTVFFISHRLGVTKYSDRVMYIEDGIVKRIGKHEELMRDDEIGYKEMYMTQQSWYE